jgi:hypothetical protein
MNKISWETTLAMALMELIIVLEVFIGKLPIWSMILVPIAYGLLWLWLKIFLWDKRKQFDITISSPEFRKNDLITINRSGQTALVVKVNADLGNRIILTVFPIKVSKNKIANICRLWFIKTGCWLRSVSHAA